jgi:hypothetical protein
MQYQVPQFIDTEDNLVGPFSLRQFIYVGGAGVICGICYFFVQTWLFVIVTIIALGGAFALAFLKINGRPLIKVAAAAFNFYWKPQTYVWKPEHRVTPQHKQPPAAARALPPLINKQTHPATARQAASTAAPVFVSASASTPDASASHVNGPSAPVFPASVSGAAAGPRELPPVETIARGDSLHKSWEDLQSGTRERPEGKRTSDRQFLEKKMEERYQIFQRQLGDRAAARRVDYR